MNLVQATLEYTITDSSNLGIKEYVIQKAYVASKYIYALQRRGINDRLYRCLIDAENKTANAIDFMTLNEFGHGQTLEQFQHTNGDYYFWIITNGVADTTSFHWGHQIARIQYQAGVTIERYTDVTRLAQISSANYKREPFAKLYRVDAALSSSTGRLAIMAMNSKYKTQFSCYQTDRLNELLDDAQNGNKIVDLASMESGKEVSIKPYLISAYTYPHGDIRSAMPYRSIQGLELSDGVNGRNNSLYFSSGQLTDDYPAIMKTTWRMGGSKTVKLTNKELKGSKIETQGVQLKGSNVYVGISIHISAGNIDNRIYSIAKSKFN